MTDQIKVPADPMWDYAEQRMLSQGIRTIFTALRTMYSGQIRRG